MRLKQIVTIIMGIILMFGSLPFSAMAKENTDSQKGAYDAKDETIYGKLASNGTLQSMYVINTFHIDKPGTITDHGDYTDIRNLSNLLDMEQDGRDVHFQVDKDEDFHYQGYLESQRLPWDIEITYLLDGDEVNPDELAGVDGSLEIQIKTSANEVVDDTFYDYFMMQISLTLDSTVFSDIQAPDGTKAKNGKDTSLTFSAMPGEDEEFIVSAEVTDFEMDPIEISATPASMPIDDPDLGDMKDDIQTLVDAIGDLNTGVSDLDDGVSDLNDGAADLSTGSNSYLQGINQLDQSSSELVSGSSEINDVLQQVADALQATPDEAPDMSDFKQLPDAIHALANGLEESADGLDELRDNYDEAYGHLDDAMNEIPEGDMTEEDLEDLLEGDVDEAVVDQLLKAYEGAQKAKGVYEETKEGFDGVSAALGDVSKSVRDMADNARTTATEIADGLDNMDDLDQLGELQSGISELSSEYQTFHQGLVTYTNGVGDLASNYQDIDSGIGELANGTSSLKSGTNELHDGTKELSDETSDLPDEMQSEVDDMMSDFDMSDYEPISFVSDKNTSVDVVQFVLQTDPIEIDEPETVDDTDDEEEQSLWDRFLDLFRW